MQLSSSNCVQLIIFIVTMLPKRDANWTIPEFIQGSAITCENEEQVVTIPWISDDPCITCVCQQGEVVCQKKTCPEIQGCYLLLFGRRPSCCDVCKGCHYENVMYSSGEEWTDSNDPCVTLTCEAGIITRSRVYCHVPCHNPLPPEEDQCCPSCEVCLTEVNNSMESGEAFDTEDPCITCRCQNESVICHKAACPVLPCPPSKYVHPPDSCCPECRGNRRMFDLQGKCLLGMQALRHGKQLMYDQCTHCSCNVSTAICERTVCPPLQCPPDQQVKEPEDCCPYCREPEEKNAACTTGGQAGH